MTDVTWLAAPGAPFYEVSSDGRVRSVGGWVKYRDKRKPRLYPSVERKTFLVKGYRHVTLNISGKKKNFYIHLLVCEAFHGPRPSTIHEVRHLNGDPFDNRSENLAWGTKKENAQDSIRHGTNKEINKTHCKYGHLFDKQNTAINARGTRGCRACRRRNNREWYKSNRVEKSRRTREKLEKRAAEEGRTLRKKNRTSLTEQEVA
jgi:hypothetical protein